MRAAIAAPIVVGAKLRKNGLVLECREKPGRTFSGPEARTMAGVLSGTLSGALTKAGSDWAAVGDFHFRRARAGSAPVATSTPVNGDAHEARPRSRGDLGPINTGVAGRAARVTPAERLAPAGLGDDGDDD